jgi:4-hydroxy-tetrahydrodipicolinate reductase
MNNLISREAATATVSCRFSVVASRLATRGATIPTGYAGGYLLSSLRNCEMRNFKARKARDSTADPSLAHRVVLGKFHSAARPKIRNKDNSPDSPKVVRMTDTYSLAVHGAAGRMGQRIVVLAQADKQLNVASAVDAAQSPLLGRDAGEISGIGSIGVVVESELTHPVDVVIDFSTPDGLVRIAEICGERQIPLVAATTGLSDKQREAVLTAAQTTAVVMAPSMSLAVNLTMNLVRQAARALKDLEQGVDVEIIERHHRFKEDAPSGTALHFGRIVAEEMGQTDHVHGRSGRPGQRPRCEIGYHALRTGDNVGEHTIVFGLMGETIDLTVRGHTRDSYAYGALAAAKFVVTQKAGIYSMNDVLGLK